MERKAYFCRQLSQSQNAKAQYQFCELPENAGYWKSEEAATRIRDQWNAGGSRIGNVRHEIRNRPCHARGAQISMPSCCVPRGPCV